MRLLLHMRVRAGYTPFMHRRPHLLRTFLAFALFWPVAHARSGGAPADAGRLVGGAPHDAVVHSSPAAAIGTRIPTPGRATSPDSAICPFLASGGAIAIAGAPVAVTMVAARGIRGGDALASTYDATAPPAT